MMADILEIGHGWHTGLSRDINEDSILYTSFNIRTHMGIVSGGLFAVADGMGGHSSGEVASDLAIKTFQANCIYNVSTRQDVSPLAILTAAFEEANERIIKEEENVEMKGMGTTLTSALIMGEDMYIAHVGDSRCYIISEGEAIQVTRDHSVVQQLLDSGSITDEEARIHPQRNLITRVLGHSKEIVPDLHQIKLYAGDNILLCSDGLHGVLTVEAMSKAVMDSPDVNYACAELIAHANLAGGPDNISVIIVKPGNLPSRQSLIAAKTGIRRIPQEI
jgi:serine/threonine protein phosphatase PrpC